MKRKIHIVIGLNFILNIHTLYRGSFFSPRDHNRTLAFQSCKEY